MRLGSLIAVAVIAGAAASAYHLAQDEGGSARGAGEEAGALEPSGSRVLAPGSEVVLELIAAPSPHYRSEGGDDPYRELAERAAGAGPRYDASLARAARELAYHTALLGRSPPEEVFAFLLRSAGAPETSAAHFALHTNSEGDDAIERAVTEALSQPPAGDGDLVFGVGEASTPGAGHARRIVVLSARRSYRIEPAPRFAPRDSSWTLRGELPPHFGDLSAAALYPDGEMRPLRVRVRGRRFEVSAPTGSVIGPLDVGIDGVGRAGPAKLLQLRVEVGRPLPRRMAFVIDETDPPLASIDEAEEHATALLAADRADYDLPPLETDPALAAVARRHSEEMRDAGYFGHQSPTTGLLGDRLRAAGIELVASAENLAKNDTLAEAQASLMASIGHRANLLSDEFTHVGVGLARSSEQGSTQWYVTQVFGRKAGASRSPSR